eukprot:scaffold1594_cov401-Prasinococcus_capsulatus_cf.AAC.59
MKLRVVSRSGKEICAELDVPASKVGARFGCWHEEQPVEADRGVRSGYERLLALPAAICAGSRASRRCPLDAHACLPSRTVRQRWTIPKAGETKPPVVSDEAPLSEQGLRDGSTVTFKDLGPQVGYSTVFFWEYFGPMAVYPLFYYLREYIYDEGAFEMHDIQLYAMIAWYALWPQHCW